MSALAINDYCIIIKSPTLLLDESNSAPMSLMLSTSSTPNSVLSVISCKPISHYNHGKYTNMHVSVISRLRMMAAHFARKVDDCLIHWVIFLSFLSKIFIEEHMLQHACGALSRAFDCYAMLGSLCIMRHECIAEIRDCSPRLWLLWLHVSSPFFYWVISQRMCASCMHLFDDALPCFVTICPVVSTF